MDEEIIVRTIDHPGIEPVEALYRLRSHTPDRGIYLIESLPGEGGDDSAPRYSLVGYRVRRMQFLPPAADVNGDFGHHEKNAEPESFAQALAMGTAGTLCYESFTLAHGVKLHLDTRPAGHYLTEAAVMVYDHDAGKVHVAGRAKGKAVDRLLWELEHAPAPPPFDPDATQPLGKVSRRIGEKALKARTRRLQQYLDSELTAVVLAEEFSTTMAGADPLDVYRALRVQSAARFGFFMDFGDIPESFRTRVTGVSSTRMHRRLHGGAPASAWASMVAVQPSAALFGDPPALAARALREVEETSRTLWGDAFGYICPGGASEWFLAETCATIEEQSFVCATGARIDASTDPEAVPPETERGAAAALRALATAQANAPKPAPDKPA